MSAPDVLLVSLGSTPGLRASDEAFAELLRSGGATVEIARAERQRRASPHKAPKSCRIFFSRVTRVRV